MRRSGTAWRRSRPARGAAPHIRGYAPPSIGRLLHHLDLWRHVMRKQLAGAALGLALTAAGSAGAVTVTFTGGTLQTFSGLLSATYVENGFEFDVYGEAPT